MSDEQQKKNGSVARTRDESPGLDELLGLVEAYERAREMTAAYSYVENELLNRLAGLTRGSRMASLRAVARLLGVPKTTLARRRLDPTHGLVPTSWTWMTPEAYVEARNTAFEHVRARLECVDGEPSFIERAPFVMESEVRDGPGDGVAVDGSVDVDDSDSDSDDNADAVARLLRVHARTRRPRMRMTAVPFKHLNGVITMMVNT